MLYMPYLQHKKIGRFVTWTCTHIYTYDMNIGLVYNTLYKIVRAYRHKGDIFFAFLLVIAKSIIIANKQDQRN